MAEREGMIDDALTFERNLRSKSWRRILGIAEIEGDEETVY